jgi:ubiquinone biosynthesis accessory factor UbiJ
MTEQHAAAPAPTAPQSPQQPQPPFADLLALPLRALEGLIGFVETQAQPPQWLVAEAQGRMVLLLNHVLQSEPQAMERLKRQSGKRVHFVWRSFSLLLKATPVGLLDLDDPTQSTAPDLTLTLTQTAVADLAASLAAEQTPPMRIEGDVQLAAEVGWLTQHVRWDIEDDLARVVGNVPAHTLGQLGRAVAAALKGLLKPNAAPNPQAS